MADFADLLRQDMRREEAYTLIPCASFDATRFEAAAG